MYDSIFEVSGENSNFQTNMTLRNSNRDENYTFKTLDESASNGLSLYVTRDNDTTRHEINMYRRQANFYTSAEEAFQDTMGNLDDVADNLNDAVEDFAEGSNNNAGGNSSNDELKFLALNELGEKGKSFVENVVGSFDEVAQDIENQTGKSRREARADLVKLNALLPKSIVSDVGDTSAIAKQLVDAGYAASLVETLTDSVKVGMDTFTEKQKSLIEKSFGDSIKDGNIELSTHSIMQMAKNQAVLKDEDIAGFVDQISAGNMDKELMAKYFATLSENRGKNWYKAEDVSKFTNELMSEQMTFIAQKYKGDESGRRKAVEKLMQQSVKAQYGTSNAFGNSEDVASEINSFTGATEQEKIELGKKYLAVGIDARKIESLIKNQDIAEASKLIGLARAKASDVVKSNDSGKIGNLEAMGWSVSEIKSDPNFQKVKSASEYLKSYNEGTSSIVEGTIGDLLENETQVSHTMLDKFKAFATRNVAITEIASVLGETGLDISDIGWGAYLSKKAFGVGKSVVGGIGAKLGVGAATAGATGGAAGATGASAAVGSKVALGTMAKTVGKVLGPIIAVGETLYDGYSGYKSADEWEVGKTNATLSTAIAGNSEGAWGAGTNALKWGALGATIGSVVPVVGTAIGGGIGATAGAITGYFGGEKFSKSISSGLDYVGEGISNGASYVGTKISDGISNIKETSKSIFNNTKNKLVETKEGIVSYSLERVDTVKNYSMEVYNTLSDNIMSIKDNIYSYFTTKKEQITSKISGMFDSMMGIFGWITDKFDKVKSWIPGLGKDSESASGEGGTTRWYEFWKKDSKENKTLGDVATEGHKQAVIQKVFDAEGGYSDHKSDRGGKTKHGITEKLARSLGYKGEMVDMPKDVAEKYYGDLYDRVKDKHKLGNEGTAIAFDLAVNSGEGRVKDMIKSTGDDPEAMYDWRKNYYNRIVEKNPSQNVFLKGWHNRVDNLKSSLAKMRDTETYEQSVEGVREIKKSEEVRIREHTSNNSNTTGNEITIDMSKIESLMAQNNILMQSLLGLQVKNTKGKVDPNKLY